jgi:hypothetical protein
MFIKFSATVKLYAKRCNRGISLEISISIRDAEIAYENVEKWAMLENWIFLMGQVLHNFCLA